jgi:hypothetical protein
MSFIGAAIGGVAAIGGALIGADASRHAANTQADAAKNATDAQLQMFNQNKADLAPWAQGGRTANTELMRLLGLGGPAGSFDPNAQLVRPFGMQDFQQDPGYQFRLQQGENALVNQASALGGVNSGRTLKDLTTFGQRMGSQEYGNAFNRYQLQNQNIYNRLSAMSGSGENAAGMTANLGANAAALGGQFGLQGANAQAAGIIGQNNAIQGGIQGLMQQWLQANALQQGGNINALANQPGGFSSPQTGQDINSFLGF